MGHLKRCHCWGTKAKERTASEGGPYEEMNEKETPPSWGGRRGYHDKSPLLVVIKGQRELENQAVDGDAQEQLRGFRVAFEPHGAGGLFSGFERALVERERVDFA